MKINRTSKFTGNGQSGRKCAVLYTIVENCRRLKIDVRKYLTDVLTRLPALKTGEAVSLTPNSSTFMESSG